MKLTRLEIRRLPGITRPFAIDASDAAIVLVCGPNGSGKSSLCRGVSALLWPQSASFLPLSAAATFASGDARWKVEREGAQVAWLRDGDESLGPDLPSTHLARCFVLGVEDLLAADDASDLAAEIRQQMSGGFPLEELLEERALPQRRMQRGADARELREAQALLARLKEEQRLLLRRESELARLKEEQTRVRTSVADRGALERARDLVTARDQARAAAAALARFPEGLAKLHGDEADRLRSLRERRARAMTAIAEGERDLAEAERRIQSTGLAKAAIDDARIRAWRLATTDVARLFEDAADAARAREEAFARRAEALCVLGAPPKDGVLLDDADHKLVESLMTRAQRIAERRTQWETERELLTPIARGLEPEPLRVAARALRAWLGAAPGLPVGVLALAAACFVACGALGAATVLEMIPMLGGTAALCGTAIAGGMLIALALRRRRPDAAEVAFALAGAGAPTPESWTRREVEKILDAISDAVIKAERAENARHRLAEIEAALVRLGEEASAWEADRDDLAQRAAVPHGAASLALAEAARAIASYRGAAEDVVAMEARRDELQKRAEAALAALVAELGPHVSFAIREPAHAAAALEDIDERHRLAAKVESDRRDAERAVRAATFDLDRIATEECELFERAGLAFDQDAELQHRVSLVAAFREADERARFAQDALRAAEQALGDRDDLRALSLEDIESLLSDALRDAEESERLAGEIGAIESDLVRAREGRAIEDALARVDAAREALALRREAALRDAAGFALLEDVRDRHERVATPAILARVRALFAAFTGERYEVRVSTDGRASLRAFDARDERALALEELSAGTRTQLLLAARLAFAERAAGGRPLPIFLDEALGVSDDERARAAIRAVATMAGQGWQIWYLTCQPADMALWKQELAQAAPGLAVREIDLAALRDLGGAGLEPVAIAEPQPPIDATGLTPEEFARRAQVPALDPHGPVGSIHLFHALQDDLPLLARVLALGIDAVGPWEQFSRSGRATSYVDPREVQAIDGLVAALRGVIETWRIGRPRPIDRADLLAAAREARVNARWNDALAAILDEQSGDASRVLAVLESGDDERTKGFHASVAARLRELLTERGAQDDRAPAEAAALRHVALREAAPAVEGGALDPMRPAMLASRLELALGGGAAHREQAERAESSSNR